MFVAFVFSPLYLLSRLYFHTLSTSSLYLFYENSLYRTIKKDTSCYILPDASKRSIMPSTSPGSSKTIPHLRRKPKLTNRTKHSGSSLSKRLLAIGYRLENLTHTNTFIHQIWTIWNRPYLFSFAIPLVFSLLFSP